MRTRVDWIWLFLKPSGRLTRWPYFLAMMLLSVLSGLLVYRHVLGALPLTTDDPWEIAGMAELMTYIVVVTLWPMFALSAKRAQDMGLPPLVGATVVLPLISIVAYFVFMFAPGNAGPNRYGAVRNAPPQG